MTYDVERALDRAIELGEVGIQVAAYVGDDLVVDTWRGDADPATGAPVDGDTLFPVFVAKAVVATALHVQAERGFVDYDAPIASYWPEFAANGKAAITVRDVLNHRSGVPQMPEDVTPERLGDWDWMVERFAAMTPLHAPQARTIYHPMSFGWLIGEVVRRTDPRGRSLEDFVHEEICQPLKITDLWIGVPADQESRVAPLIPPGGAKFGHDLPMRDVTSPPQVSTGPLHNQSVMRRAFNPGTGGVVNARSTARLFAMLANGGELDGVRLLSEARVLACTQLRDRPHETDEAIPHVPWLGIGGYWVGGEHPPAQVEPGNGPHVLCNPGAGGSISWADLDARLAVSICHNRMFRNDPPVPVVDHPFWALGERMREIAAEHRAR